MKMLERGLSHHTLKVRLGNSSIKTPSKLPFPFPGPASGNVRVPALTRRCSDSDSHPHSRRWYRAGGHKGRCRRNGCTGSAHSLREVGRVLARLTSDSKSHMHFTIVRECRRAGLSEIAPIRLPSNSSSPFACQLPYQSRITIPFPSPRSLVQTHKQAF